MHPNRLMKRLYSILILLAFTAIVSAQTADFRTVAEKRLKKDFGLKLSAVCNIDQDPVAHRVFLEYGAMFLSLTGGPPPANCLLADEAAVQTFQSSVSSDVTTVGGVTVTLQKAAMKAYLEAAKEAAGKGLAITPRGGATASMRSFSTTVDLWKSRFDPALTYWVGKKRITPAEAAAAKKAPLRDQIAMVLAWEEQEIYFSKDLSKSILYSVAIPGASQHCFMLALDVEQYGDKRVREIMAKHGWFQTVKSDLPHFTYLGLKEKDLTSHGLTPVTISGQVFWIPNM